VEGAELRCPENVPLATYVHVSWAHVGPVLRARGIERSLAGPCPRGLAGEMGLDEDGCLWESEFPQELPKGRDWGAEQVIQQVLTLPSLALGPLSVPSVQWGDGGLIMSSVWHRVPGTGLSAGREVSPWE
jgi:hypothetical protein